MTVCPSRESSAHQAESPGSAKARGRAAREARPGSKEVHAQRLQQRKTRRREKVRQPRPAPRRRCVPGMLRCSALASSTCACASWHQLLTVLPPRDGVLVPPCRQSASATGARDAQDRIEEMQAMLEELAVDKEKLVRHNAGLQAELGADEEELRKLRAAEESTLPALADEELAARFGGDVTLTARGAPVTLTPDQARRAPARARPGLQGRDTGTWCA